ncbi:hypothetical protein [Agrococcus sp. ARC_14]|uniref:hypothetical protein n=1 Tax=Agrococcus sp. ARC_14 TaxID=2919927 RepID=UPI001F061B45|nr:hypothetical protein [Agrococcus sp. ARC_14]MCH1882065.1 hypothetical protein [Agrococcus sp. ARC_14]
MVSGIAALMLFAALGAGLLLIAGGIVLLVLGLRRHDDSTSRPFLALGVGLLIVGSVVLLPSLFLVAGMITGLG